MEEMDKKSTSDLSSFLVEELNIISPEESRELQERCIDGCSFTQLSREDFALIYPDKDKFLLGSKLYKLAQKIRINSQRPGSSIDSRDTQSLLADMSELEGPLSPSSYISTPGSSRCSTPFPDTGRKHSLGSQTSSSSQSSSSRSSSKRKCIEEANATPFKLPHFSPNVQLSISKDSFYTTSMRNKLIKEGCNALRGHCWGEQRSVGNYDKRNLAIRLYELAPKSLGDYTDGSKPEASIYGQVVKWFQNHSYLDKKSSVCARKPCKSPLSKDHDDVDEDAVQSHLSELAKELKRKSYDDEKTARLLSLTFAARRSEMLSQPANSRISSALQKYRCLNRPVFLMEEVFHSQGHRFERYDDVREKIKTLGCRWNKVVAQALIHLAEESGYPDSPEPSDDSNVVAVFCLTILIDKLKQKKGKSNMDPLDAIICFAPTVEEALKKNAKNTFPYAICIGTPDAVSTSVIVCNKKVITDEIGQLVVSGILVLLAVHYAYELSFNPVCQSVMEFLQEKFLGDALPSRKMSTSYCNLFRAINCIELKLKEQEREDPEIGRAHV